MFGLMNRVRLLFRKDRRGVTALEYGLIAAAIGGVVLTSATTFGGSLKTAYAGLGTTLTAAVTAM